MTRAAVAGLGLIGGSLALALPARGFDRDPERRRLARGRGIDVAESLAGAVEGADVVFLAVSTGDTPPLLAEAAALSPGALFSDCASLKLPVLQAAAALPAKTRFVGGHPLAGSTARGPTAADPGLFRGRPWALVPAIRGPHSGVRELAALVSSIGALPVVVDAAAHDAAMTRISHLPHAVAASLARVAARRGAAEAALAGPGLLDTTRLADTPLDLALELSRADPAALAEALEEVGGELSRLSEALRSGDADAVRAFFEQAGQARRRIVSRGA